MTEATELYTVEDLRKAINRPGVTVTVNSPSLFGLIVKANKAHVLRTLSHIDPSTELDSYAIDFGNHVAI